MTIRLGALANQQIGFSAQLHWLHGGLRNGYSNSRSGGTQTRGPTSNFRFADQPDGIPNSSRRTRDVQTPDSTQLFVAATFMV